MWDNFVKRVVALQTTNDSDLALLLNPRMDRLPLAIQRYDEPFFPFGKAIINATRDVVCAYVFDLGAYLALGAAGAIALERTLRYAADVPRILHGPFVGTGYSAMTEPTGFGVDAVTLLRPQDLAHYIEHPPYAAFVISNREMDTTDAAAQGGFFWQSSSKFTLSSEAGVVVTIRLAGEDVLYAGRSDDFAQAARSALAALR